MPTYIECPECHGFGFPDHPCWTCGRTEPDEAARKTLAQIEELKSLLAERTKPPEIRLCPHCGQVMPEDCKVGMGQNKADDCDGPGGR